MPNPDETSYTERSQQRIEDEKEKFDEDHYIADIYENDIIQDLILHYQPYWYSTDNTEKCKFS